MYKVIKTDNTLLGYTEKLVFVKFSDSGCFVEASKQDAIGMVYGGLVYNLIGRDAIKDAGTDMAIEIDGGDVSFNNEAKIIEAENAACENDTTLDTRLTEIENVLCELDKGATTNG